MFGFPKVMQENLKEALDELLRRERVLDQLKQFTDNTGHLTSELLLYSATTKIYFQLKMDEIYLFPQEGHCLGRFSKSML